MEKVKILFLAANPSRDLRLDEEIREITTKIRAAEYRDSLELISCWALRPDDLQQALLEHQPHVLHFSGHGSPSDEIIMLGEDSNPHPVSQQALVELLRTLKDKLQLVVLNACYSRPQAEAIATVVDCTIGMNKAIGDKAAIKFAAAFYRALGFGRSVQTAFELGRNSLTMEGTRPKERRDESHRKLSFGPGGKAQLHQDDQIPQLITRQGVDASRVFLDDTTQAGEHSDEAVKAITVVPKGLRYFDEHDAGFFLQLMPGPYRDDGLPESLHFWKTRIEESDADKTFRVGVIYGPSGCGKSSLVRAGLIPHLDESVIPILIEATPDDTEKELLGELKKLAPFLNPKTSLRAALRRKVEVPPDRKLLIVLDQFEQWLHGRDESRYAELVEALRECDGAKVQCVLMIRDDFWTPLCRFLKQLEVPLRENENGTLVDLFDKRHAKQVLILYGQAYGALPASGTLSSDQGEFVDQAIDDLAENGRVICVRLALFAQMVRRWEWKPATLKRLGGTKGVGVAFLEESLTAKEAPASVRQHQQQAEAVLRALLPEQGTDIKGARRSQAELLEQSGYGRRPDEFSALLEILGTDLRLITPTEPIEDVYNAREMRPPERYYQLTHDYLVPSLREWLDRKQRETRNGRAEVLLAERARLWSQRLDTQALPGFGEWLDILRFTDRRYWGPSESNMMRRASWKHSVVTFCVGMYALMPLGLLYSLYFYLRHGEPLAAYLGRLIGIR